MAIKKADCPDCSTHTITLNPFNTTVVNDFQKEYKAKGKRRSKEQIINKIIGEWAMIRLSQQGLHDEKKESSK